MHWAPRSFPIEIRRQLIIADLSEVLPEELEQGEEDGALAGNRSYFDLRGCGWDLVRTALDIVGVAAATIAISAYGATPVSSCNAGAFGGQHQARYPYVAFFLPKELASEIMLCAEASDVGLLCDENGIAQIYGQGEMDLVRFAETAWKRNSNCGTQSPSNLR